MIVFAKKEKFHNLYKWQTNLKMIKLIASSLLNKKSTIKANEWTLKHLSIKCKILQRLPLIPFQFLFYKVYFLVICLNLTLGPSYNGFIDQISLLIIDSFFAKHWLNLTNVHKFCLGLNKVNSTILALSKYQSFHLVWK